MTSPSLISQLGALFLKDEKTAVLPDVVALFQNIAQNGVNLAGLAQLRKALVAIEADALSGGQQFFKDAANLLVTFVTAATTTPPAAA